MVLGSMTIVLPGWAVVVGVRLLASHLQPWGKL